MQCGVLGISYSATDIQLLLRWNVSLKQHHYTVSKLLSPARPCILSINPTGYPTPTAPEHAYDNQAPNTLALSRKKRGVAFPADLWPQHSTLKISLTGMTPEQEQFTKNNVNKWAPHVNLKFEFTQSPDADIRIAADNNSYGSSSTVGVNAKKVPAPKPTMFIGFANGLGAKTSQTVAHEFGHALGLKHEHQHPYRTLEFNAENVYEDHDRYNQPRQQADEQILKKFDPRQVYFSQYDPSSIMHYGMPGTYFTNNTPTPENYELSETDKQFVSDLYPKNR
ncbi:hypothetical protein DBR46_09885 [Pseudomonas sp. KBW05]|nr:hypothetical protein DBR46_09885 [Pseudomonas sp. KBW05]